MSSAIQLGCKARDAITGFTGIVTVSVMWLNGCRRITLQPQELKDGRPIDPETIDVEQVVLIERDVYKATPVEAMKSEPQIGERAVHTLDGFSGTVVGVADFVNGCRRLVLASSNLHDNKPIPFQWFDVEMLERDATVDGPVAETLRPHGGPSICPPRYSNPVTIR